MDRLTVYSLFRKALEAGGRQLGPFEIEWEISGRCLMPVRREIYARKARAVEHVKTVFSEDWATSDFPYDWLGHREKRTYGEDLGPYVVYLTVKCRMCDQCLKERRDVWAARARVEMRRASRVWFGTFTFSPEWQSRMGFHAAAKAAKQGDVLEALPFDTQLHYRHLVSGVEITKYWKRLRKAGHRFRYFVVLEAHKTGLPHYHALVFENGASPLRKRTLEAQWPFGFTQWRLATDDRAVWYVAKYLGKSSAARVRASLGFGDEERALAVASEEQRGEVSTSKHGFPETSPLTGSVLPLSEDSVMSPLDTLTVPARDRAPT